MKTETLATAVETFYAHYEQLARKGSSMRQFLDAMKQTLGGSETAAFRMTDPIISGNQPIFQAVSDGIEYRAVYNRATNRIDLHWKDDDFGKPQVISYDKTLEYAH